MKWPFHQFLEPDPSFGWLKGSQGDPGGKGNLCHLARLRVDQFFEVSLGAKITELPNAVTASGDFGCSISSGTDS